MKVRILKVHDTAYILQVWKKEYSKYEWVGLEITYNISFLPWSGVFLTQTWSGGKYQYDDCRYKSKGAAMRAIKRLKAHLQKKGSKDEIYKAIAGGNLEVVHEEDI